MQIKRVTEPIILVFRKKKKLFSFSFSDHAQSKHILLKERGAREYIITLGKGS